MQRNRDQVRALADDPRVHPVEVQDGSVTLRGMVAVSAQRDRAERITMAVHGVTAVDNHVRVWPTVSADDAIVGADQITVTVVDNDVTLTGTGVAHVHDALTVRSHPS